MINRRDFLKTALASGALYSAGGLPILSREAQAAFGMPNRPIVVNVSLLGGPDFRHLLPPAFSTGGYSNAFWKARARSFGISKTNTAMATHWRNNYIAKNISGNQFGVLKTCTWLNTMFNSGNVAVINNVVGSISRDHEHAIMVMDQGNRGAGPNDINESGWGGRLAAAGDSNIMALSYNPRPFCFGESEDGSNFLKTSHIIGAADTRQMGLYEAPGNVKAEWHERGKMARSLKSYYSGLAQEMSKDSAFRQFVDQERNLRRFGRLVGQRLRTVNEPTAFKTLYDWDRSPMAHPEFALQARNLHDALACADLLNIGLASMEMGAWDTHDSQKRTIEANFRDIFGAGRAFDILWRNLPPHIRNRVVFCFQGEFGRQLRANGSAGTDHGRGNSVLLVGNPVNGGIYGDMFPNAEISRMNGVSSDISGLTAIDHVYGALCDWSVTGSGDAVFPRRSSAILESGVNPNRFLG